MNSLREDKEFNVLGYNIRLKEADEGQLITPEEIVELVMREADMIREKSPNLNQGQIAVLVALKVASEKMSLDKEYRDNITRLQSTASDALQFIEEVSPTTV